MKKRLGEVTQVQKDKCHKVFLLCESWYHIFCFSCLIWNTNISKETCKRTFVGKNMQRKRDNISIDIGMGMDICINKNRKNTNIYKVLSRERCETGETESRAYRMLVQSMYKNPNERLLSYIQMLKIIEMILA